MSEPEAIAAYGWQFRGLQDPDPFAHFRWALLGAIAFTQMDRVADVGCDTGALALDIAPQVSHIIGVDPDPAKLETARAEAVAFGQANVVFQKGRLDAPGIAPQSCTKVLSTLALHELDPSQQREAVMVLASLVKPGGELYLADVCSGLSDEATKLCLDRLTTLPEAVAMRPFADDVLRIFAEAHPPRLGDLLEWGLSEKLSLIGWGGTMPILGWVQFAKPRVKATGMISISDEMRAVQGPNNRNTAIDFDRRI